MVKNIFITDSSSKTKKLAKIFAKTLKQSKNQQRSALVIGLFGNLGAGKTSFTQGLADGFGIKEKVQSPTFVIFKKYNFSRRTVGTGHKHKINAGYFKNIYHFDCYRIENPKEILDLGFKEIISDPANIVVIEWAEKIDNILPRKMMKINFEVLEGDKRKITFQY